MKDLDGRCFLRRGNTLVPADIHAEAFLHAVPDGKEMVISAHIPRNPKFHRWFFAMLHKVCENREDWTDEDELLDAIKHAVGHVQRRMRLDGSVQMVPRSIAFESMGEDHFRRFVKRALYVLQIQFGIDGQALMEEVDREQEMNIAEGYRREFPGGKAA